MWTPAVLKSPTQVLAKQLLTAMEKLRFWRGKVFPCLHWQGTVVPSSRNRFFVVGNGGPEPVSDFAASQWKPVMTLSDTIGHLARLFNSLADQRHFCHDHFLNLNAEYFHKHHILKIDMFIIEPMFSKVKVSFFVSNLHLGAWTKNLRAHL